MKITSRKRRLYLFPAMLLIVTFVSNGPMVALACVAATSESATEQPAKNMVFSMDGINNPTSTSGNPTCWTGSKVYYGLNGSSSLLWRVLDMESDGSVFLFADDCISYGSVYHHRFLNTTWDVCSLRAYLNGYIYVGSADTYDEGIVIDNTEKSVIGTYFTEIESSAIKESTVSTANASNGFPGGADATNKLFLLSIEELKTAKYGFVNDSTRANGEGQKTADWWWIRSPGTKSKAYAAYVSNDGSINTSGQNVGFGYQSGKGIRPAFRLDMSMVLFSSLAEVSKHSYSIFGSEDSLVKTKDEEMEAWELTLRGTEESLQISTTDNTAIPEGEARTITISHKPASILENATQVSAMLLDSNDSILYYGKINEDVNATSSELTIPNTLEAGSYTLRVFAEDLNGNQFTDFASEFSDLTITVEEFVPVVQIIGGIDEVEALEEITLTGTVEPENASHQQIIWSILDAGDTEAEITENSLLANKKGMVTLAATVVDGLEIGEDYVQAFEVIVKSDEPAEPEVTLKPEVGEVIPGQVEEAPEDGVVTPKPTEEEATATPKVEIEESHKVTATPVLEILEESENEEPQIEEITENIESMDRFENIYPSQPPEIKPVDKVITNEHPKNDPVTDSTLNPIDDAVTNRIPYDSLSEFKIEESSNDLEEESEMESDDVEESAKSSLANSKRRRRRFWFILLLLSGWRVYRKIKASKSEKN